MPECVNDTNSGPFVFFKGRWLCSNCFEQVKAKISAILDQKEKREGRILDTDETVGINQSRLEINEFRRVSRIRGTHLTITRGELKRVDREDKTS